MIKATVPTSKLLRGGESGISAARYARITDDLLRPSTLLRDGPHADLLRKYQELGEKLFEAEIFEQTAYYRNAEVCIDLIGHYFPEARACRQIQTVARTAIRAFFSRDGKSVVWSEMPGHSKSGTLPVVRRIADSECYEVIDGHHRLSAAIVAGRDSVDVSVIGTPVRTPIQEMLLDVLWQQDRLEVYQPVPFPEVQTWHVVRLCSDRFQLMLHFINETCGHQTGGRYLDVGASYGWFVAAMLQAGYDAHGLERDPMAIKIGHYAYGLPGCRISQTDAVRYLTTCSTRHDIVSCFSVLHHFAMGKGSISAVELLHLLDRATGRILFLDSGQNHEGWFRGTPWDGAFLSRLLREHTTFREVRALGTDTDARPPYAGNYRRTLFACSR